MKEVIIAILGSGAFSAVVAAVISSFSTKKKKKSNEDIALRLLLLGEIKRQGKEHQTDGFIVDSDYRAFIEMYQTYKALGGDGYADRIMEEMKKLPITLDQKN